MPRYNGAIEAPIASFENHDGRAIQTAVTAPFWQPWASLARTLFRGCPVNKTLPRKSWILVSVLVGIVAAAALASFVRERSSRQVVYRGRTSKDWERQIR